MPRALSDPSAGPDGDDAPRWTARAALGRAHDVLRDEGIRSTWFKVLGETVYRRLALVELRLDSSPPIVRARVPLDFGVFAESELDAYTALRSGAAADDAVGRLRGGHRCYVARHEGRAVAVAWVAFGEAPFAYLGRTIALARGEAYLYDAFTTPEYRGLHIYSALLTEVAGRLRDDGTRRVLAANLPENRASARALSRAGFTSCGKVGYVKVGRGRRDFLRLRRLDA